MVDNYIEAFRNPIAYGVGFIAANDHYIYAAVEWTFDHFTRAAESSPHI